MNSVTKSTLWMLVAYALVAVALTWWMGTELRTATRDVMEDTALLIGREVSGALLDVSADNLISGDRGARERLRESIETTARASAVLSALSVVDRDGRVVASDDNASVGTVLSRPDEVFNQDRDAKLFSTFSGPLDSGTHLLLAPLIKDGAIMGYIQMNLNNRVIGRLFEASYWRLLMLGLAGLVAILVVGILLHLRLSRYQNRVSTLLESALSGQQVEASGDPTEFGAMQTTALRIGQELHAARGRAEMSRQELDTVANVLKVGMLLLGPSGRLEFSNAAAREMLTDARPDRFESQLEALRERFQDGIQRLRAGGLSMVNFDLDIEFETTRRRFRVELYAMDRHDGGRYLAILKDRDMIDALELDLRSATRFRGLSTLYVGTAHDLRGPLNNMVVNLELLKQSINLGEASPETARQKQRIEIIQEEIYRLNRYVQALLDLAAPAQDSRQELDLVQALNEIAGLIRAQSKMQRVELDWQLPETPVPIMCQQIQLRQVLLNIIINALEAMPSGGKLSVRLRQESDAVIVSMCDTGPGMPESLQAHIFDMHFTTKNTGTGIGLYVARSVVNELGGMISLQSTLGEGTCFEVRLPRARPSQQEASSMTA